MLVCARQCAEAYRCRYGSAPTPQTSPPDRDAALESISPILENVLSSLTGEYEKKLFDKDQEMKGLQVQGLRHDLNSTRHLRAAFPWASASRLPRGFMQIGTCMQSLHVKLSIVKIGSV